MSRKKNPKIKPYAERFRREEIEQDRNPEELEEIPAAEIPAAPLAAPQYAVEVTVKCRVTLNNVEQVLMPGVIRNPSAELLQKAAADGEVLRKIAI